MLHWLYWLYWLYWLFFGREAISRPCGFGLNHAMALNIGRSHWPGIGRVEAINARCSGTLALRGVPKCRRSAIWLSESVVSRRSRPAISSFPASLLRRAAKSASRQPRGLNSSLILEPSHPCHQIRAGDLDHQVIMVAQETIGLHLPARLLAGPGQGLEEVLAVNVVQEDVLTAVGFRVVLAPGQ